MHEIISNVIYICRNYSNIIATLILTYLVYCNTSKRQRTCAICTCMFQFPHLSCIFLFYDTCTGAFHLRCKLTLTISSHKLSRVTVGFGELRLGDWALGDCTLRTDANDFFAPHLAGGGLGTLSPIVARGSAALESLFASALGLFCLRLAPPCFRLSVLLSTTGCCFFAFFSCLVLRGFPLWFGLSSCQFG